MPTKKPQSTIKETELYPPIKAHLEGQGYEVKGEVGKADLVAVRGEEEPVIVELKTAFSLTLFHQAVDRLSLSDHVYIAVPRKTGRMFQKNMNSNKSLCRRLGLGLITVRMKDLLVEVHLDPAPRQPRKSKPKTARLLREFAHRVGDPNVGGTTRTKLVTAYRQDALRCLFVLSTLGPKKAADVSRVTKVEKARNIMSDDHYGWFERVERGIYAHTPKGEQAMKDYEDMLSALRPSLALAIEAEISKD